MSNNIGTIHYSVWESNYTGSEYLSNLGAPILLIIISIASFVWFGIEIRKKRLNFKAMFVWFTLNVIYTICMIYIFIVTLLQILGYENAVNIFDKISHYLFGFELTGGKEWIFPILFAFISFMLIRLLYNTIKIEKLKKNIDILNREISILTGKVNKTIDYSANKILKDDDLQEVKKKRERLLNKNESSKKPKEKI